MIDLQLVLEEARRELDPFILLWRKEMEEEVLTHLSKCGLFETHLEKKIVEYIEQYGCSIEKATNKILQPEMYWNPSDEESI